MKKITILIAYILLFNLAYAQEFKCKAIVNASQIQGVDKKIFNTLEQSIETFVNTRRWTEDSYDEHEKIEVVYTLVLSKVIQGVDGGYTGTLNIQANRPIYNATYKSQMVNYVDARVAVKYIQYQTLDFNENRVNGNDALASNLTALIAYYNYIILGLDYDSFELKGGNLYHNKALNICNNAPENANINGWKSNEGNNRNRYWLADQLLNNRFANLREAIYTYHRLGLDDLSSNPESARANMQVAIAKIADVNKDNPQSVLIQFFFNAKGEEILNFMANADPGEKQKLIPLLAQMDVVNAQKYYLLMKN